MITIRHAADRGRTRLDWLYSWHTFSFGDYQDPHHVNFSTLRVINEDFVAPAGGFATHGHRDMEIITWILEGQLEHRDSLGNGSVIRPGEVQRMSAGTGIRHSEFNPSQDHQVHLLQIWILPETEGIEPGYEQKAIEVPNGTLRLMASRDGRDGSVTIHQDTDVYVAHLGPGDEVGAAIGDHRRAWVQVARGRATINGQVLGAGDGASIVGEHKLSIHAGEPAELLLFDMP